jgi:hypothetical protein
MARKVPLHISGDPLHLKFLLWLRGGAILEERERAKARGEEPQNISRSDVGRAVIERHPRWQEFRMALDEDRTQMLIDIGAHTTHGGAR